MVLPTTVEDKVIRRMLQRLGDTAALRVRPVIPSKTLREGLKVFIDRNRDAVLRIPHYWAVFVHDGRGVVRPVRARWLVWFQNPADDPRTDFGRKYPIRKEDVRRLTKAQWEAGLAENARRRAAGAEPFMIVTKVSGPVRARPFFDQGLQTFPEEGEEIIAEELEKFVLKGMDNFEDKAVGKIG